MYSLYSTLKLKTTSLHLGSAQVERVLRKLNNPKRRLKECTLAAGRWPEVKQLILQGLEGSITKNVLEAYFRNEEKSGCSTLVDVKMKGRGVAILTLKGNQGKKTVTCIQQLLDNREFM